MGTTSVIYGMTQSIYRASENYIPCDDGWRRLRDGSMPAQDLLVFEVPDSLLVGLTKETVAEALFVATNAPSDAEIARHGRLAVWFGVALRLNDYRWVTEGMDGVAPTALSVGDTVTVSGQASVACDKRGWREIA